uniref:Uncharacterized protein n=1 Tax=Thermogemmatispora argillosa TaxID=2045280 RepID=A0A455T1B6_9CHLR|nr:hypothetical protein KTA_04240 [Thermogemmatispora argillosa]
MKGKGFLTSVSELVASQRKYISSKSLCQALMRLIPLDKGTRVSLFFKGGCENLFISIYLFLAISWENLSPKASSSLGASQLSYSRSVSEEKEV